MRYFITLKLKHILIFPFCLVTINPLAKSLALWQSSEYIKKAFFEIAYKNEYQSGQTRLRRWQQDIRYQIDYFKLPRHVGIAERLIHAHFQDLSTITKINIGKKNKQTNFKIVLTRREHYKNAINSYTKITVKNIEEDSNCLLQIRHNDNFEITSATIIIPVDHAMRYGLLPVCIIEELTQSTGLPNDSDWVSPSIANDKSVLDLLTGLDYLLLKILYDKHLKAGFSVKQSIPIVDKILSRFEKQNKIINFVSRVKKLTLNKLFE